MTAVFDNNGAIDLPYSMVVSPDSSRIGVAGTSGNMFMALMYDANGTRVWANTNSNVYPAGDLAFGPGNVSYFAAGTYFPQDPNPYQMASVKFDAVGNQSWIKSYSVGDRIYRVGVDAQGNILATGVDSIGYMDWITIKTDANGNLLWSQRYDGGRNKDETPNMLALDASGAVYVTGKGGPNPGSGNLSYVKGVVVKYNPDGTPQWAVWLTTTGSFRYVRVQVYATPDPIGEAFALGSFWVGEALVLDSPFDVPARFENAQFQTFEGVSLDGNLRTSQVFSGGRIVDEIRFSVQTDETANLIRSFIQSVKGRRYPFFFAEDTSQVADARMMHFSEDYVPVETLGYNLNGVSMRLRTHESRF